MIAQLRLNNINSELIRSKSPVLLACIQKDFDYEEQMNILQGVSEIFNGALKIFILDVGALKTFGEEHNIEGTPTFLIFNKGREKDRMLGKQKSEKLASFIKRVVPSIARELNDRYKDINSR